MRQFDPIFFTPPSGDTKKPRTLYKGGGGGDGGAAQRKAAEDARIAAAVKQINQIFAVEPNEPVAVNRAQFESGSRGGVNQSNTFNTMSGQGSSFSPILSIGSSSSPNTYRFDEAGYNEAVARAKAEADAKNATAKADREKIYTTIGDDFRNNAMVDLTKDYETAAREQKFTLARAGLSGGSRDIDSNQELFDRKQQGVLRAANLGIQAANNARSADDKTRTDLISSIYAGLSGDAASQQAFESLNNNRKAAQDEAGLASLSGFFDAIRQQQQQAAYTQGFNGFTPTANTPQRGYGTSANKGFNGNMGNF